jgi:hypothetical protein
MGKKQTMRKGGERERENDRQSFPFAQHTKQRVRERERGIEGERDRHR